MLFLWAPGFAKQPWSLDQVFVCQGVDVGASLIEVTPHLINVGPFGSELSIDLPGAISVEDVGIEVRAAVHLSQP